MDGLNLFKLFMEAPGDDGTEAPPPLDGNTDPAPDAGAPPDLDAGSDTGGDPPDLPDDVDNPGAEDDMFGADDTGEQSQESQGDQPMQLNEKISAILNQQLYNRYLELLNKIATQLSQLKDNSDMLYTIAPITSDAIPSLTRLDENIRMYLRDTFMNEDYSANRLFFNKCLNLLAIINDNISDAVKKGIKNVDK